MSKKLLIIAASVLILLALALFGYYFILTSNTPGATNSGLSFRKLFQFGGGDTSINVATSTFSNPANTPSQPMGDYTQKLRLLSSEPVAGSGLIQTKVGTLVRYIEKATGHIFEVELFSNNSTRLSNTTIPLIYNALWRNDGGALITQNVTDTGVVKTFAMTLKEGTTTDGVVSGTEIAAPIIGVDVNSQNVFYLSQNNLGSTGFIMDFNGKNKQQIWSSPIQDWNVQYVNQKTIAVTTKPYQNINGYMYFVHPGGGMDKILSKVAGLSTLVRGDGQKVLLLANTDVAQLFVFDVAKNTYTQLTPATFPEKCVWGNTHTDVLYCAVPMITLTGSSLTDWYMGSLQNNDAVWMIDTKTNVAKKIEDLYTDAHEPIDVNNPHLSSDDQYFVFTNKINGELWSLNTTK